MTTRIDIEISGFEGLNLKRKADSIIAQNRENQRQKEAENKALQEAIAERRKKLTTGGSQISTNIVTGNFKRPRILEEQGPRRLGNDILGHFWLNWKYEIVNKKVAFIATDSGLSGPYPQVFVTEIEIIDSVEFEIFTGSANKSVTLKLELPVKPSVLIPDRNASYNVYKDSYTFTRSGGTYTDLAVRSDLVINGVISQGNYQIKDEISGLDSNIVFNPIMLPTGFGNFILLFYASMKCNVVSGTGYAYSVQIGDSSTSGGIPMTEEQQNTIYNERLDQLQYTCDPSGPFRGPTGLSCIDNISFSNNSAFLKKAFICSNDDIREISLPLNDTILSIEKKSINTYTPETRTLDFYKGTLQWEMQPRYVGGVYLHDYIAASGDIDFYYNQDIVVAPTDQPVIQTWNWLTLQNRIGIYPSSYTPSLFKTINELEQFIDPSILITFPTNKSWVISNPSRSVDKEYYSFGRWSDPNEKPYSDSTGYIIDRPSSTLFISKTPKPNFNGYDSGLLFTVWDWREPLYCQRVCTELGFQETDLKVKLP